MNFKPLQKDDLSLFYSLYKGNETPFFFRALPDGTPLEIFALYYTFSQPLLAVKDRNITLGYVTINIHPKLLYVSIGLLILPEYQKQGKALEIMKEYCKHVYKMTDKIRATICEKDTRTKYLLEKGGFILENTLINESEIDNELCNDLQYIMLKDTYERLYASTIDDQVVENSSTASKEQVPEL